MRLILTVAVTLALLAAVLSGLQSVWQHQDTTSVTYERELNPPMTVTRVTTVTVTKGWTDPPAPFAYGNG